MASMEYQRDGSVIVTNDAGDVLIVQAGPQAEQDAAIQAHVGPQEQPPPTLDDKVSALTALLVEKQVLTAKDVKDATAIDVAAVAAIGADTIKGG